MKSYLRLAGCRGVQIKVRAAPRKNDGPDLVRKYTGNKSGMTSLIYDPAIAIMFSITSADSREAHLSFPIDLAHTISDRLAKVYRTASENDSLYVKDEETGMITIDKERARSEFGCKLTAYTDFLRMYPGIDYSSENRDRAVMFEIGDVVAPMPLNIVRDLVENLDRLDVYSYSVLLGLMDQNATIDKTTKTIDKKLDMVLSELRSNRPRPSGTGDWTSAPNVTDNFDLFDTGEF